VQPDPKQGEREYFARIGPEGIAHSLGKPFSDEKCAANLANMAALFHLLDAPPQRVVDFGCGVGWLSMLLARRGYKVTGVDISPDAIAAARDRREAQQISHADFVVADYEEFSADEKFDAALFYDSLHHAEDERAALRCAYRSLRDDGMLIAIEPGHGHSTHAHSLRAVQEFGVHEKDMPADYIVRLGREAGFRRHVFLPRPHELVRRMYKPGYTRASGPADLFGRYVLAKLRAIRFLLHQRRKSPIVVMWK
jgi:ubiquinone/menaquinone biosynthesis C-methylase UbiE